MGSLTKYPAKGLEVDGKAAKKGYEMKRQVWIEPAMFYSGGFRALSSKAMWVLLRFHQKRTWSIGKKGVKIYDNYGLTFTYGEAIHFKISVSTFHTIIKRLIDLGFIDVEHQGGFYGRDYSRYCLSDRWREFGTPRFKKVEKKRVLQAGLDVRSHQKKKMENAAGNHSQTTAESSSYRQAVAGMG
jgi:hypothetical protein